jgi:CRP/FNR family transcriptional regulator, cyclic AMP receptor protein
METLERILADHPFFEGLDNDTMHLLVSCASNVRFDVGAYLFHEGEEANQFYLIREGRVALEDAIPGRDPITIQTLSAGDVLGWSWLIPPYRWRFDARASEPVRAFALDGACLRAKSEADHDLGYEMLKRFTPLIAERLQATRRHLTEIYTAYCDVADGRI